MRNTREVLENLLEKLENAVPRLIKENHGVEFWIEFLERADAIKLRAGLDHQDWVVARIGQMPIKHGMLSPSDWMLAN